MRDPTPRLLALLGLLQSHERLSGSDLAARLSVDGRTLRRYIGRLEELGVPLTADRGRHGAYRLMPGFQVPPAWLASRFANAAAAATISPPIPAGSRRVLAALSRAAGERRSVRMRYRSRDGQFTERDLDVYGLAFRAGHAYAVGWCHLRRGVRSFRLDRVDSVEGVRLLARRFERPENFDALAHLNRSLATIPRAHTCHVWLDTDLDTARHELFDSLGLLEVADGGVRLAAEVGDLPWMAQRLAGVSFPFQVVQPAALRTAIRRHAAALLRSANAHKIRRP